MSKTTRRGATSPEMNITPMIDVCFQLIIFFMVTAKIIQDEAIKLVVPKVDNPVCEVLPEEHRMVVNVVSANYTEDIHKQMASLRNNGQISEAMQIGEGRVEAVRVSGRDYRWPEDMQAFREMLEVAQSTRDHEDRRLEVVVRSGLDVHYQYVLPVLREITSSGLQNVNLTALRPE